ncbi:LAS superfamily LD-carboxypeptidase LdcB [Agromyces hippuratus]|uniref:LAS superfamily LD-carboxypeptidase LdcB n=1 Tax=Agromyces hippuratus TaxID=286438 RepID=A0A852X0F5_9MICO|nr:M15 family metallopeptidase [Agromyces hippuratus]NYG19641.1 LAS superfamily LD-carboxypeptidase LdcB [Agromyces hippuratus]
MVLIAIVVAVTMMVGSLARSLAATSAGPADTLQGGAAMAGADGVVTEADGAMPDGVSAFDEQQPGVVNLDPDLLHALREAAVHAREDGIEVVVNSGWRSPEYQDRLLGDAVADYGSEAEAARWVATAETSAHVAGEAVDVGSYDAIDWLSEYGAGYGLCPIYDNEPWHFELHPEAIDQGCPAKYFDPTEDPRMQQ